MSDILTDEQLAALERLHGAAGLGEMSSTHIISPEYQFAANLCAKLPKHGPDGAPYPVAMTYKEWCDWLAALHNHFPALLRRLREAETKLAQLRNDIATMLTALDARADAAEAAIVRLTLELDAERNRHKDMS